MYLKKNEDGLVYRIKKLCFEANLSLNKLEMNTGIGKGVISKWNTSVPAVDKVIKIADFFNVSMDYLTCRSDDPSWKPKKAPDGSEEDIEIIGLRKKAIMTPEDREFAQRLGKFLLSLVMEDSNTDF